MIGGNRVLMKCVGGIGNDLAAYALCALLWAGCGGSAPDFNADRAFGLLLRQTELGPRVPGSEAHRQAITFYIDYLRARADTVILDTFSYLDTVRNLTLTGLTNIIARFESQATQRILIGAHFDSRPVCDLDPDSLYRNQPVLGANDGASGTAVLLELAELLASFSPSIGVDLALFDLEDWGDSGLPESFCIGSQHYAAAIAQDLYEYVIVVDMIGDREQQIYREAYSQHFSPGVVNLIWNLAAELGISTFHSGVKYTIFDDHRPFQLRGIPAIVIIDFDYPYWHTSQDTPDKCSPQSLENVGKILVAHLRR